MIFLTKKGGGQKGNRTEKATEEGSVGNPISCFGTMRFLTSFSVYRLAGLWVMMIRQATVFITDGDQVKLIVFLEMNKALQRLPRTTRPELDGPAIAHLLKAQVGVGNTKLVSIAIGSDDESSTPVFTPGTIEEFHFVIFLTTSTGTSHAPPLLFRVFLPEVSILPVQLQAEAGFLGP